MSTYGVTSTGYVKKSLATIVAELNALFTATWPGVYLGGEGAAGQLIGILSKRESDLWDGSEEIYTSRNINEATGASLDNIVAEVGIRRIDASNTTVNDVLLWGSNATLISAGRQARQSSNLQDYTLVSDITLSSANPRAAKLTIASPSTGTVYTLILDSVTYTYTALVSDTIASIGAEFITLLDAGDWTGTTTYAANVLTLDGSVPLGTSVDFTLSGLVNFAVASVANAGIFTADTEGAIACPASTLDTIMTPVSGWTSVANPIAGVTGRDSETDEDLRARATSFFSVGKATETAIRQTILNEVSGVIAASVTSNRTDTTDSESRPPHSFEAVVEGGSDLDIANVIWETAPAGIQFYGSISQAITDSEGRTQLIGFSRPELLYTWIKIQRDYNTEETYPTDGDARIKANIVTWGLENLQGGTDLIRQKLSEPVYGVPGIGDFIILVGDTTDGTTPTSYNAVNLAASARQIVTFDTARIIVEDIP